MSLFTVSVAASEVASGPTPFVATQRNWSPECALEATVTVSVAVAVPLSSVAQFIEEGLSLVAALVPGVRPVPFGHIGDGNLHFFVSPGVEAPDLHEQVDGVVYEPLARFGGAVSAEHGIGLEKRPWLHLCRSEAELGLMRQLKMSLDPRNILNPGKVI